MRNQLANLSKSHKIMSKQLDHLRGELFANGVMRGNVATNLATLKDGRKMADMEGDFITVSGCARAQNTMKKALVKLLEDRSRIIGQLTVLGPEVRELKVRIVELDAAMEAANVVEA